MKNNLESHLNNLSEWGEKKRPMKERWEVILTDWWIIFRKWFWRALETKTLREDWFWWWNKSTITNFGGEITQISYLCFVAEVGRSVCYRSMEFELSSVMEWRGGALVVLGRLSIQLSSSWGRDLWSRRVLYVVVKSFLEEGACLEQSVGLRAWGRVHSAFGEEDGDPVGR